MKERLFRLVEEAGDKFFTGSLGFIQNVKQNYFTSEKFAALRGAAEYHKNDPWSPLLDSLIAGALKSDAKMVKEALASIISQLKKINEEMLGYAADAPSVEDLSEEDDENRTFLTKEEYAKSINDYENLILVVRDILERV